MSKKKYQEIKAEIFKLSTLKKFVLAPKNPANPSMNISKLKNGDLAYFSTLDNL